MERKLKDYVGKNHETIGTDILSILQATTMAEAIFGKPLTAELQAIQPDAWYPIAMLLRPVELLANSVGPLALRQLGRKLFQLSHAEQMRKLATSAGDLIFGLDGMYRNADRGEAIGGWRVLSFHPGQAVVEKTTPHHCVMEEGIIAEAFQTLGIPALVTQKACFRSGADACVFSITSMVRDERWMDGRPPLN